MRVQARQLQRNGVLKVRHKVKSSGKQQRDLLIAGARAAKMKAVYCIYCTEPQRKVWKQHKALPGCRSVPNRGAVSLSKVRDEPQPVSSGAAFVRT